MITREEQIYLLIGAQDACDRSIRNQMALIKGFFHISFYSKECERNRILCQTQICRGEIKSGIRYVTISLIREAVAQFSPGRKFGCQRDNDISLAWRPLTFTREINNLFNILYI